MSNTLTSEVSFAKHARTLLVGVVGLALAVPAAAATPTFVVRYRSAANIYLDGGRAQGLSLGDRLVVLYNQEPVAELEILFLAEESASCRVVSEKRSVRAGDTASLLRKNEAPPTPAEVPTATAAAPTPTPPPEFPLSTPNLTPSRPWAQVRGFVSAGLYKVWDNAAGFDFEQRMGRVDFSLMDMGGHPLSFNTRFRSRRDQRSASLSSTRIDRRNDLYELSLRYEPPSDNVSFELGRLGTSRFSSVGYLDGGLVRVRLGSPLQVGGFFGQQAEVDGLAPEATGQKYGAFLRLSPRGTSAAYDVILAVVREFSVSDISREFVGIESRFGTGAVSVFERAEVDFNRGWRRDLTNKDYQLSNVSVAANFRFSPSASAVLSYDGLRNYRDYYTRDVPERIFDDLLHQGYRASLYLGRGYGLNATAGFGLRQGERGAVGSTTTSNSYSYNAGIRHGNLFSKDVSVSVDVNAFRSVVTNGYLLVAQLGKRLRQGPQFNLSYGRSLYSTVDTGLDRRTEYLRFNGRVDFLRHVYFMADAEYDRGDDLRGLRGFFELGYQF